MIATRSFILASVLLLGMALAQPDSPPEPDIPAAAFQWPAAYAPSANQGGNINITIFGDITTFNPVLTSNATEAALISGNVGGPNIIYRDWVGSRAFQTDGAWNMVWASNIEEVVPSQEYIVTLREGWKWSDGDEMDADDVLAAFTVIGDPDVESNSFSCSEIDGEPMEVEKLGQYQYRLRSPKPVVNMLAGQDCGAVPAHIYMPIYETEGAAGIKALWGVDSDVTEIVSGGPYVVTEFKQGERLVLTRNPQHGQQVQAADGSPLPGPDSIIVTIVEDRNAQIARVITGQADYFYPDNLDQLAAIKDAQAKGAIGGELFANLGPSKSVDFITYNFNNSDECKAAMFREPTFRQAVSIAIDRQALVDAALGGIGVPAKNYGSAAIAPFGAQYLPDFEFAPEKAVEMLGSIGFTDYDDEGVLMNPDTGCRVEFDLQFNSGNDRRSQEALVISQTAAPYGIRINPREVSVDIWSDSITGDLDFDETGARTVDYDAQIWGLAGGDIDNPSSINVLGLQTNLNSWNKSKVDVEPWEILMDRLSKQMDETLDLDARVALYNERADIMREYLPMTPLISRSFHFYTDLGNIWSTDKLDAVSIEGPYRPGNFISLLVTK